MIESIQDPPNERQPIRRKQNDLICFEVALFIYFVYCTFDMWQPDCSWFFNTYVIIAYTYMIIIRRY